MNFAPTSAEGGNLGFYEASATIAGAEQKVLALVSVDGHAIGFMICQKDDASTCLQGNGSGSFADRDQNRYAIFRRL